MFIIIKHEISKSKDYVQTHVLDRALKLAGCSYLSWMADQSADVFDQSARPIIQLICFSRLVWLSSRSVLSLINHASCISKLILPTRLLCATLVIVSHWSVYLLAILYVDKLSYHWCFLEVRSHLFSHVIYLKQYNIYQYLT